eukprot:gene3585-4224_t
MRYATAISACEKAREPERAMELLAELTGGTACDASKDPQSCLR